MPIILGGYTMTQRLTQQHLRDKHTRKDNINMDPKKEGVRACMGFIQLWHGFMLN
jgi:hypothetical protein